MRRPITCQKCKNEFVGAAYKSYFTNNLYHHGCLERAHFPNKLSYYVHKKIGYFKADSGVVFIGGVLGFGLSKHFLSKWGWKGFGVMIPTIFLSCVVFQYFCPDQRKK